MIENPYLFACEWYKPDQVFSCLNHNLNRPDSDRYAKIPADVTSIEFAAWLTEEYRLAMAKGIELGKRDAAAEFATRSIGWTEVDPDAVATKAYVDRVGQPIDVVPLCHCGKPCCTESGVLQSLCIDCLPF